MEGIPHHLIDTVDIKSYYTVADFYQQAREAAAVNKSKKIILIF